MTERIDLKALKEAAEKAYEEACDLRSGSTRYMDDLSEYTSDTDIIRALVKCAETLAKVRACRTEKGWILGGHPGLTQLLPDMDEALHPFTVTT
jgi:hypothetical protein